MDRGEVELSVPCMAHDSSINHSHINVNLTARCYMHSKDYAVARCLSICLSVCLSHVRTGYCIETAKHILKLFFTIG